MNKLVLLALIPTLAQAQPHLETAKTYAIKLDALDVYEGPTDAKVTMVATYEYADPYSLKVRPVIEALEKKYGAELRVVWKPFVVHLKTATQQAYAACAANKQKKWAALDTLLWDNFKARKFDDANLMTAIDAAKLDRVTFDIDMKICEPYVKASMADLRAFHVDAVPTFFINGRWLSGARQQSAYEELIDAELKLANARIQSGAKAATYYQTFVVDRGEKP